MYRYVRYGSSEIPYTLAFRDRKTLGIRVYPDASVEVLAPLHTSENAVMQKVKSKAHWILKQINRFNAYPVNTAERKFVNGETHLYLGRQFRLKAVPDAIKSIKLQRGYLFIHSKNNSKAALELQLQAWYKEKAVKIFTEIITAVLPKFRRYGITSVKLSIRSMRNRWGSCSPSGRITLNVNLIKASKGCIEYVVIHEICHLVHHAHSKAFYRLLSKMYPGWEKWKENLENSLTG